MHPRTYKEDVTATTAYVLEQDGKSYSWTETVTKYCTLEEMERFKTFQANRKAALAALDVQAEIASVQEKIDEADAALALKPGAK